MVAEVEASAPVLLLAVVDDISNDFALVTAAATTPCVTQVHDATFHVFIGLGVTSDLAIVSFKLCDAVVPVNRRCKCITCE